VGAQFGLLNPCFVVVLVGVVGLFWGRGRGELLPVYLFCMGAPLFVIYLLYTLRARVHPNWIAPSILPLWCLMVLVAMPHAADGKRWMRRWLGVGMVIGLALVALGHETNWIRKIVGRPLPAKLDPLRRVRGWTETTQVVAEARTRLQAEGKPVFLICSHYGITGLFSFYLPEARAAVRARPLVYFESSPYPRNQMYFWEGYQGRVGENAIHVTETDEPRPIPDRLKAEFAQIEDLGIHEIRYRGQVWRRLRLLACRGLLPPPTTAR
jgi:hypothetical protein